MRQLLMRGMVSGHNVRSIDTAPYLVLHSCQYTNVKQLVKHRGNDKGDVGWLVEYTPSYSKRKLVACAARDAR
jgi:hypothetical protein